MADPTDFQKIVEIDEQVTEVPLPEAEAEASDSGEYDGQLPDFSDEEPEQSTTPKVIGRLPRPKGPLGRKKVPVTKPKTAQPKKAAKKDVAVVNAADMPASLNGPADNAQLKRDLDKMLKELGLTTSVIPRPEAAALTSADMDTHKFWKTQPVVKFGTSPNEIREGPLEANKKPEEIRQEPYDLHPDFKWDVIDIQDCVQLNELQELLSHNYVEDSDASFRFDYESGLLEWALKSPGYIQDWHIGIRVATTNKLVGFISGTPLELRVRNATKKFTEINFLCVHKKLRSKRLAPLLIKEVTRRTHLQGVFQAIYTGGGFLPTPVSKCRYYHRTLNPKKLVDTGFISIPRDSTLARTIRLYKLPDVPQIPGVREMTKKDVKAVARLLRAYLARLDLAPMFSNKDVEHNLLQGRGKDVDRKRVGQVVWTYVVEDPETKEITDMFSFYSLPSSAVLMKPHTTINAAYLFYYATTAAPSCKDLGDGSSSTPVKNWQEETAEERQVLKERLIKLMNDALIMAEKAGFDVVTGLTLADNVLFLNELKFGKGDGYLHYYLYNYGTKPIVGGMNPGEAGSGTGVVML